MKRLFLVAALALLWAAPANAFTKQSGTRTMALDGVSIAYDLYEPDGAAPAGGWPGVVVMHGLGGNKDSMASIAQIFAGKGYATLAYTARGHGTSGGVVGLAGPEDISTEREMLAFFEGLPEVSDTQVGAWGISYGGGQILNGLAAGVPYRSAEVVETWTDLFSALLPQNVAKSGIVLGFAKSVDARSPLILANENDAIHSTNIPTLKALLDPRSSLAGLSSVKAPVYFFQGRVDYAFDVTQAVNGYAHVSGPKHLYIGQFGHPPSTFPAGDFDYVMSQGVAWFDHYLRGMPNGIDASKPVTIAAASGAKRTSYAGLPKTKNITVGFRGTSLRRTGPKFQQALETFGTSLLKVQVRKVDTYPRLVAVVMAGNRVISHGAIVPKVGLQTIRLASYVQYLPKGTRLSVVFGPGSGSRDIAYFGFGDEKSISLGSAVLTLQTLPKPVG